MKVIIDTSVFHDFDNSSKILYELKKKEIIRVYISPMLLEETLRLMLYDKASSDKKKRLQFILDISSERWLEDNFDIFRSELSLLPRRKDYQFLNSEAEKILKDNIRMTIDGGMFKDAHTEHKAKANLESNIKKANTLRTIGLDMRQAIAYGIKKLGIKHKNITETWQDFKARGINKWGVGLIKRKDCYGKAFQLSALLVWAMNKNKCPYFYDWVRGMLYADFYNKKYPELKIDKNAQADIQHLIFLREVDAIVSEENNFMRKVWEDLYAPLGKKYFNMVEVEKLC